MLLRTSSLASLFLMSGTLVAQQIQLPEYYSGQRGPVVVVGGSQSDTSPAAGQAPRLVANPPVPQPAEPTLQDRKSPELRTPERPPAARGPIYDGMPRPDVRPRPLAQQLNDLDGVLDSTYMQRLMRLMEENAELKSELKLQEAHMRHQEQLQEMRLQQVRQAAERSEREVLELREVAERLKDTFERERRTTAERENGLRKAQQVADAQRDQAAKNKAAEQQLRERIADLERELDQSRRDRRDSQELRSQLDDSLRAKSELEHRTRALEAELQNLRP